MKRSWLSLLAGVVSLIATLSSAGQQADSGQAQANLANSSSSSVPRLVKFSGVLRDLTGKPLAGPVEVNFAIYREQGDAAPLWQEAQTLALDEQGRYTVLLGAMQAEGLPMELFATGGARWLAAQAPGAEAQPRVLLVSVPYALKAGDAETLAGKPVSDFVLAQQLKEQVQTEVAQQAKKQPDRGQQALAMVLSQGPTPMVTSQGQTSFTCPSGTSGDCVTVTQSSTGRALYAVANSSAEALRVTQNGTGYGLLAVVAASGAVYGVSTATTGSGFAIRGESASTGGRGILGLATATTGGTIGLWGNAASTGGTGLLGDATAATGYTYGLRGRSYSSSGTGILAYTVATTGTTKGLWAEVYSADGTAAVFQNTVSGKLLSGVTGTGSGTEVFSVAGTGNLVSAGSLSATSGNFSGGVTAASFTGNGAGLTNLTAANISAGTAGINISGNAATATNADMVDGVHAGAFALQTDLTSEASARQAADTTLQNNINSEAGARAAGDAGAVATSEGYTDAAVTGEAATRAAADTSLQSNINAEATARAAADNARAQLHASNTYQSSPTGTVIPQILGPVGNSTSTASGGFNSNPLDLVASAWNTTGAGAAQNELFRWQAEPADSNTPTPSGTLHLLFASGSGTPVETGLSISSGGIINFASGQTFAGTGTVTSVGSGTGLTGGPVTTSGTLSVDHTVVAFQSDLSTEASARQAADTTLQNNLNTEATARATADTNEATLRASADTALQSNIDGKVSKAGDTMTGTLNVPALAGGTGNFSGSTGSGTALLDATQGGTGAAVRGRSTAAGSFGVYGQVDSTSSVAVQGYATASNGLALGVVGASDSTSGTGVQGQAGASSGATAGVRGSVSSPAGTAGVFDNTAGGKILSGRVSGTEKFAVDGSGNVTASGSVSAASFAGDGSALTGVTSTGLSCTGCVGNTQLGVNYAGSASKGGDAANAVLLNGLASSAFQPAGSYATLGANTFTATQTLSSGNLNLPETSGSSAGVINLGGHRFIHAYGGNTFVGQEAGNFSTSGDQNTATGDHALYSNTDGGRNTAAGDGALYFNTGGSENTATGSAALVGNTTGWENTATGVNALGSNTTGNGNTASGGSALEDNRDGSYNTASGYRALYLDCYRVSSGCTANYNTALGYYAGVTADGMSGNITGANNTFIGALSGPGTSTNLTNATAIGYQALVSASNALVLGGTGANAVNVGIGTATPAYTLDVQGTGNFTGLVTFASGQTFPGTGTITGVTAGTDLTGGGTSGSVTLNLDTTKVPTLGASSNTFTGSITAGGFSGDGTNVTNVNAAKLGGLLPAAYQPAGSYAVTTGPNSFAGTQTISSGDVSVSAGNLDLPRTTSASVGVINLGGYAFIHGYGTNNTFVGLSTGNFTMTGAANTASGYRALNSNTTGGYNTASGVGALQFNTTGGGNTASGEQALLFNTTGHGNAASGGEGLFFNTTGSFNTASGFDALFYNTDGHSNTASGYQALFNNCYGVSSGCTASYNTALGYLAGVTSDLGYANKTGANNTFLGAYSGPGTPTQLSNATAIGYQALVSASNALVLGGTGANAVNVGIGTATPAYTLDVQGTGNFTGLVTFASGQTFPGTGTITGVTAGTDLTGGGTSGGVTLNLDTTKVPTLGASSNTFTGSITASAFSGDGTNVTNVNAAKLGGLLPAAYQPAGSYAVTTGPNSFAGTQTISSGDLSVSAGNVDLPQTASTSTGVITVGGTAFIHACCSGSAFNTFVGPSAGNFTTTGSWNTASGLNALHSNTTGIGNTASGVAALYANTSGGANTASGVYALLENTTGSYNTASGDSALIYNCQNVPSGCTANYNTALGFHAGVSGIEANANVTGARNTFVGAYSGPGTSTQLNNATAIGYQALVSASNSLVLGGTGSSAVNVGIGTESPRARLEVVDGDVYASTAGNGVVVKSPDGTKCARIGIDNSGALSVTSVTCP